jgi:hypothetical protein
MSVNITGTIFPMKLMLPVSVISPQRGKSFYRMCRAMSSRGCLLPLWVCVPLDAAYRAGSSGAGKTTLLDVLARRKTGGYITGDISVGLLPLPLPYT